MSRPCLSAVCSSIRPVIRFWASLLVPVALSAPARAEPKAGSGPVSKVFLLKPDRAEAVSTGMGRAFAIALQAAFEADGMPITELSGVANPKNLDACGEDPDCFSDLLGAEHRVVASGLSRLGEAWIGSLSLLDLATSRVLARAGGSESTVKGLAAALVQELTQAQSGTPAEATAIKLPDKPRFVILNVQGAGLESGTVLNLSQVIARELQRLRGASVMSQEEVEVLLGVEKLRQVLAEECNTACFDRIAGALNADYVLTGRVGQLEDTYVVQLTAIEQVGDFETFRHAETFRGASSELMGATRHAVQTLFGLTQGTGSISVSASPEGARLVVDEAERGVLPLPPATDLRPGRHTVLLDKDGYLPFRSEVYVNPDGTSVLWAELERAPERWYQKWWVWTLVGLAAAGVAAGATAAVTTQTPDTSRLDTSFR